MKQVYIYTHNEQKASQNIFSLGCIQLGTELNNRRRKKSSSITKLLSLSIKLSINQAPPHINNNKNKLKLTLHQKSVQLWTKFIEKDY